MTYFFRIHKKGKEITKAKRRRYCIEPPNGIQGDVEMEASQTTNNKIYGAHTKNMVKNKRDGYPNTENCKRWAMESTLSSTHDLDMTSWKLIS